MLGGEAVVHPEGAVTIAVQRRPRDKVIGDGPQVRAAGQGGILAGGGEQFGHGVDAGHGQRHRRQCDQRHHRHDRQMAQRRRQAVAVQQQDQPGIAGHQHDRRHRLGQDHRKGADDKGGGRDPARRARHLVRRAEHQAERDQQREKRVMPQHVLAGIDAQKAADIAVDRLKGPGRKVQDRQRGPRQRAGKQQQHQPARRETPAKIAGDQHGHGHLHGADKAGRPCQRPDHRHGADRRIKQIGPVAQDQPEEGRPDRQDAQHRQQIGQQPDKVRHPPAVRHVARARQHHQRQRDIEAQPERPLPMQARQRMGQRLGQRLGQRPGQRLGKRAP